jgi:ABC-type transporter Mla maintaining outer membrane lipid asymmetry ATPase subunit MlaF
MFGRLKMSIGNVVASYNRLMLDVYSDKKLSVVGGSEAFKATTLERGIKAIVGQMTGDEGSGMLEKTQDDVRCKV